MIAIFCLRLAAGLMAALLILSPAQVNPRFFRAQNWIALGLSIAAAIFAREFAPPILWLTLGISMALAFIGSVIWALEGAPGGRWVLALLAVVMATSLVLAEWSRDDVGPLSRRLAADAASAVLLGAALTAMLLGHFYLIAPGMSLTPLLRMLALLVGAIFLRMTVAGLGVWSWSTEHSLTNLTDVAVLWLPVRWVVGFIGSLILVWMAWRSARIRSTQSATGILYVAVIFCFLGELTGQLLWNNTGVLL
jgi:hypothetical protein